MDLGTIRASIGLNTAPLKGDIAKAKGMMTGLGASMTGVAGGFKKFGLLAGTVAVAGVALLVGGLASCVKEAMEAQKVMAEVESIIRTTGGAAHISAKEIDTLSQSIRDKTGYDDEQVQSAAAMMLTFPKVRNEIGKGNDIFSQAVDLSADMARKFGTDMPQAAKLLGKALGEPVRGVTALQRMGVMLTDQQKDMVKAFVESGDMLSAQKVILSEVATEVGGVAEAYGGTLQGKIDIVKSKFGDLKEAVGNALLPALTSLIDWANRNMPTFEAIMVGTFDRVKSVLSSWSNGVQEMSNNFEKAVTKMKLTSLYFSEGLTSGQAKLNIQNDIANLQLQMDAMNGTTKEHMAEFKGVWDRGLDDVAQTFISKTPALKSNAKLLETEILSTIRVEDLADLTGAQLSRMAAKIAEDTGLPVSAILTLLGTLQAAFVNNELNPQVGEVKGDPLPSVQEKQQSVQQWLNGNLLHPQVGEAQGQLDAFPIWSRIQAGLNAHPVTPTVNPANTNNPGIMSWPSNAAAGGHVAGEIIDGMENYFSTNFVNPVVGPASGAGGGMAPMEAELAKLTAAWNKLNDVALVGWNKTKEVERERFGDMESGIATLAEGYPKLIEELSKLTEGTAEYAAKQEEIKAAMGTMGPSILAWRSMTGALDEANIALKNYDDQIALSEKAIGLLEKTQEEYNTALEKSKDELQTLSSMKIAGEGAASDKSFGLQQQSAQLQLQILQAEDARNYALSAQLTKQKAIVDRQKEEADLQASITYDPQKRELEKLLDPLGQQEMSFDYIKNSIIELTTRTIPSQQKAYDDITATIGSQKAELDLIKTAHDEAATKVAIYSGQVEEMAKNFLTRYDEMIAKVDKLNDKTGEVPGAGGNVTTSMAGGGYTPVTAPAVGETVVVSPIYLDGKKITEVVTRVIGGNASAYSRSGGRY